MGLMNCFVYSCYPQGTSPQPGFQTATIALRKNLRAIVFLIHVSVRNILKRFLVYDVQD